MSDEAREGQSESSSKIDNPTTKLNGDDAAQEGSKSFMAKIAVQTRSFEITLYWKRSIFFLGFIAAAFTGIMSFDTKTENLWVLLLLNFATLCSFCWVLANKGSKFWQENWEKKADKYTSGLFKNIEAKSSHSVLGKYTFSVSKLNILISLYVWIACYAITMYYTFQMKFAATDLPLIAAYGAYGSFAVTVLFMITIPHISKSSQEVLKQARSDARIPWEFSFFVLIIAVVGFVILTCFSCINEKSSSPDSVQCKEHCGLHTCVISKNKISIDVNHYEVNECECSDFDEVDELLEEYDQFPSQHCW